MAKGATGAQAVVLASPGHAPTPHDEERKHVRARYNVAGCHCASVWYISGALCRPPAERQKDQREATPGLMGTAPQLAQMKRAAQ